MPMIRTLCLFWGGIILGTPLFVSAQSRLDSFNVTWTTPGPGPAESMPLGNGDIGLNAWVEPGGDAYCMVEGVLGSELDLC